MKPHTFPDTRPEYVSVVYVHHNPLSIEGVFIDRAITVHRANVMELEWGKFLSCSHVTASIV